MSLTVLQNFNMAGNQILELRVENVTTLPSTGVTGRIVYDSTNNVLAVYNGTEYKTLMTGVAWAAITGKPTTFAPSAHTHTANEITDFVAEAKKVVVALWDEIAGTGAGADDVDTIREVLDLILKNKGDLTAIVKRHEEDIGDGTATSFAIKHDFNSLDVHVEVFDNTTGSTVLTGVTRTNVNVVTITAAPAPGTDALRVVVKQ